MTTHSSILAWRIPWTEEPEGLQSMGSQRVGHNWETKHGTSVTILQYINTSNERTVHLKLKQCCMTLRLKKKLSFKHQALSTFWVFNSYMRVVATIWDSAGLRPLHSPQSSPWLLISGIFHKLLPLKFPSPSSQTNPPWSPFFPYSPSWITSFKLCIFHAFPKHPELSSARSKKDFFFNLWHTYLKMCSN